MCDLGFLSCLTVTVSDLEMSKAVKGQHLLRHSKAQDADGFTLLRERGKAHQPQEQHIAVDGICSCSVESVTKNTYFHLGDLAGLLQQA